MISRGPSVYQTSYQLACEVLCRVLMEVVESGPGDRGGRCSMQWRACAALYSLPLDQLVHEYRIPPDSGRPAAASPGSDSPSVGRSVPEHDGTGSFPKALGLVVLH